MKQKIFLNNIKFLKFFDQRNLGSLPRIFLSSFVVIFIFFTIPMLIDYSKNKSLTYKNNSKAVLAYTLNNKGKSIEDESEVLNENDLLRDIFSLNDLEISSSLNSC